MLYLLFRRFFMIGALCSLSVTFSQTYVCLDLNGNRVYTNKSNLGNCSISQIETLNTYSAVMTKRKIASVDKKTSNNNIKKTNSKKINSAYTGTVVASHIQSKRDLTRKQILSSELENETQALRSVQNKIRQAQQSKNDVSAQQLKNQAQEHQLNIEAISREISRM